MVNHLETLANSGGELIAAPVDAGIGLLIGKKDPVLPKAGRFAGDLFKTPFRIAGSLAWGGMKGAARLAWAGVKNLPIFPVWKKERDTVIAKSSSEQVTLAKSVAGGTNKRPSPEETVSQSA
jgi:hypothetical protein